jgi:DNA helicase-2/ATP-dependent DNA helicase PcrA
MNAVSQLQERARRPRDGRANDATAVEKVYAEAYASTSAPARGQRAGLRRPDHETVHLLQAFPDVREKYRRRFRQVLVDEYQDTNHAQYMLIRELCGSRTTRSGRGRAARADGGR